MGRLPRLHVGSNSGESHGDTARPSQILHSLVTLQEIRLALHDTVPVFSRLLPHYQDRLTQAVDDFLKSISFRANRRGVQVSLEDRVLIAGQACLLVIGRKARFRRVREVVVFPGRTCLGMVQGAAFPDGMVAIALGAAKLGASEWRDGSNVVLHEFAHHLDFESPSLMGIPKLRNPFGYLPWLLCIRTELRRLESLEETELFVALRSHPRGLSPIELFAFATEYFFERPLVLRHEHPHLFKRLRRFYRLDPFVLL